MTSNSVLYGKGVFTTIAIRSSLPLLWEKHWCRLTEHAEKLLIDISEFDEQTVSGLLTDQLKENKIVNGRARITVYDERRSDIWPTGNSSKENAKVSVIVGERRQIHEHFKLAVSPYPINSRSPLARVKSCNYLEQIMSLDEAKGRGFDEAVRLNENGVVTSACMANIFWLKAGKLYTPSLQTGCLAGTTREYVLENLECDEVEAAIEELSSADAIYLTSAGIGITAAAVFIDRNLTNARHPILELLKSN